MISRLVCVNTSIDMRLGQFVVQLHFKICVLVMKKPSEIHADSHNFFLKQPYGTYFGKNVAEHICNKVLKTLAVNIKEVFQNGLIVLYIYCSLFTSC